MVAHVEVDSTVRRHWGPHTGDQPVSQEGEGKGESYTENEGPSTDPRRSTSQLAARVKGPEKKDGREDQGVWPDQAKQAETESSDCEGRSSARRTPSVGEVEEGHGEGHGERGPDRHRFVEQQRPQGSVEYPRRKARASIEALGNELIDQPGADDADGGLDDEDERWRMARDRVNETDDVGVERGQDKEGWLTEPVSICDPKGP